MTSLSFVNSSKIYSQKIKIIIPNTIDTAIDIANVKFTPCFILSNLFAPIFWAIKTDNACPKFIDIAKIIISKRIAILYPATITTPNLLISACIANAPIDINVACIAAGIPIDIKSFKTSILNLELKKCIFINSFLVFIITIPRTKTRI